MKKFLVASAIIATLATASASAKDGAYVGFDINTSNVENKFQNRINKMDPDNNNNIKADHDSIGFGLNAGYKIGFNQAFVAPELFFDYLNNSGKQSGYELDMASNKNDRFEINNRYGAKVNLGYNFTEKFNGFVNLGLANTRYAVNSESIKLSKGASKLAPIYGLGVAYNINDKWTTKLSYDRQKFNAGEVLEGYRNITTITVVKVGLAYNF